jgi:hypothetical protein
MSTPSALTVIISIASQNDGSTEQKRYAVHEKLNLASSVHRVLSDRLPI